MVVTAALIPPPRVHLVGYHGVLAPHARVRKQVVALAGLSPPKSPSAI